MITLTDRLRKIVNPKRRGKGRLSPAVDRSSLLGGRGVGVPEAIAGAEGAGLKPPFTERVGRTYFDEQSYTSSDGFFVIVYANTQTTTFDDAEATPIPVNYVDEP